MRIRLTVAASSLALVLAVVDAGGTTVDWEIESRHLQGMRQDGIQQDTIKVGDQSNYERDGGA